MKTSGFREIDFSKTECKNCGEYSPYKHYNHTVIPDSGYIWNPNMFRVEKCTVCKSTGYLNENNETELELE